MHRRIYTKLLSLITLWVGGSGDRKYRGGDDDRDGLSFFMHFVSFEYQNKLITNKVNIITDFSSKNISCWSCIIPIINKTL